MGFHPNTLIFLWPKEDSTSEVLGHTCSTASRPNGWSNSFVLLLFCELISNHSVKQGRHKRGVECIQTRGLIRLSAVHLS